MTYESIQNYNGYEIAALLAATAIRDGLTAEDVRDFADATWNRYWDRYDSADDNPTMMRNYKRMLDASKYAADYELIRSYIKHDDGSNYTNWHEFYFYMKVTEMMEKLEESEQESDNKEEKNMIIEIELDEFQEAVREFNSQAYDKFGYDIDIVIDTWIHPDEPVTPKVSWKSIGEQSIEDAAEFARKLKEATEMAATFVYNGAIAKWDEETNEAWYELEKKTSDGNSELESKTETMDFWDEMMKREDDDNREYEQRKTERARERKAATNLYDQIYAKIMDDDDKED